MRRESQGWVYKVRTPIMMTEIKPKYNKPEESD